MPQLGESVVEATLLRWRVAVGDEVPLGAPIADIETDKAASEVPAPVAGRVARLLVAPGTTCPVDAIIAHIDGEPASDGRSAPAAANPAETSPAPESAPAPADAAKATPIGRADRGPPSSPAVRRFARAHDIDLRRVPGTGRGGRITRQDVLAFSADPRGPSISGGAHASAAPPSGDATTSVPWTPRRRTIADTLRTSLDTAVHAFTIGEIDMSAIQKAVRRHRAAQPTPKVTALSFIVRGLARTLRDFPMLNAHGHHDRIEVHHERNIGVAVDTEAGVVVPVIRRADELDVLGIARCLEELAAKAKRGALRKEDLSNGSFTLSNPGPQGNLVGLSILRPPEVGILRLGTIQVRPVAVSVEDTYAIVAKPMMYAALSYDHRVVDGRTANDFLHTLSAALSSSEAIGA